jgi:hypothetical protein
MLNIALKFGLHGNLDFGRHLLLNRKEITFAKGGVNHVSANQLSDR